MRKVLNIENLISLVKLVVAIVAGTATILVFYFTMESSQNDRITENSISLRDHVKLSERTFDKFDRTMREQRTANEAMGRTIVQVTAVQQSIKEENGRLATSIEKQADEVRKLAHEIRKSNGNTP